ncbi:MAG: hypothetical protein CXZ00_16785 [Acidobacteria bacterium]|nr:MAG: hypothetical protein CXZ00_16785 [Acidobacteriota bacterium]
MCEGNISHGKDFVHQKDFWLQRRDDGKAAFGVYTGRLLRNSGKWLFVPFSRFVRGQSWRIFLQVQDVFAAVGGNCQPKGTRPLSRRPEGLLFSD